MFCRWERCGQVKVVVKVESEEDMLVLQVNILLVEH
jgi:peptidyl-tRNA hydrolase